MKLFTKSPVLKRIGRMFHGLDVGIDLGTANILAFVRGEDIILNEPSVVAVDSRGKVKAIGQEAKEMLGRTPEAITAVRPLQNGVIADYDVTKDMLEYVLNKVVGKRPIFKPRVMICIPSGVTSVEKRAVIEAAEQAGSSETYLIDESMAAAIGADIDVAATRGHMVVDIGGGTTDVAVICLGGIVVGDSIRIGGDKFDATLSRYMKNKYNLYIGDSMAEEIKIKVATVHPEGRNETMSVRGRDAMTGLPIRIKITSRETMLALAEPVGQIVTTVLRVLEKTPPELAADIIESGIVLTGGGALLDGLDKLIYDATKITTTVAENPLECVARGTGKALEHLDALPDAVMRCE